MRRTGLRRIAPMLRSGITQTPTRRLATSRQQFADVKPLVWARDQAMCIVCGGRGYDYHHRLPRGMGGASRNPLAHSPAHLVVLCRAHHAEAETTGRAQALRDGLIVRHGITDPAEIPIRYRDDWALLCHDGTLLYLTQPEEEATS